MSTQPPKRMPENAPGDFYVQADVCMKCLLSHHEAPDLMNDTEVEFEECYFRRQPRSTAEVDQAINAILVSEIDALRYGGTNPEIISRLCALGHSQCCDHRIDGEGNGSLKR